MVTFYSVSLERLIRLGWLALCPTCHCLLNMLGATINSQGLILVCFAQVVAWWRERGHMKPGLRPRKPRAQEPGKAGLVRCWAGEGLVDYTQDWFCASAGHYQPQHGGSGSRLEHTECIDWNDQAKSAVQGGLILPVEMVTRFEATQRRWGGDLLMYA